jgi:hypothetical protein
MWMWKEASCKTQVRAEAEPEGVGQTGRRQLVQTRTGLSFARGDGAEWNRCVPGYQDGADRHC